MLNQRITKRPLYKNMTATSNTAWQRKLTLNPFYPPPPALPLSIFWVPLGSPGPSWALLGTLELSRVFLGSSVLPCASTDSPGLYWAPLAPTGLFLVSLALPGPPGLSWALLYSSGLSWALLGSLRGGRSGVPPPPNAGLPAAPHAR